MFTTSRYASLAVRKAAKDEALKRGERYVARGKKTIADLVDFARKEGENSLLVFGEKDGSSIERGKITIDALGRWKWDEC